jgi:NitT/TauT family transport system ATP-binding protein
MAGQTGSVADFSQAAATSALPGSPIIQLRSVTKTFDSAAGTVRALEPVDLDIHAGEFIAFVGPSGCGKSTLLNIVASLLRPTAGTVVLDGKEMTEPSRDVGFMFQAPVLLPWRTVEKNVLMPAEVMGLSIEGVRSKAHEIIDLVGLRDFRDAYPRQLSGGMQQRASLARLLTYEPKVLLLDEPFGALDEFTREAMNLELARIAKSAGITVLFVTHNIAEAIFLADRVVVMSPRPGRVSGVVDVPFAQPRPIEVMQEQAFTDMAFQVRTMLGGAA